MQMNKIQDNELKKSDLGKYILEKYTPKKSLNKKLVNYAGEVFTIKVLDRVKSCGDFMQHITVEDLSKKRVHRSNSCGNRFCVICTWNKAKKDAIMISVTMTAIREELDQEFIFMTLTAPNCGGDLLHKEVDKFNKAFNKLFKRSNVLKSINGYVRKLEITYNKEQFIVDEMYRGSYKEYFEKRGLQVGDNNPNYDTYHTHFHVLMAVNKSYFKSRDYIKQEKWLEMWRECMEDDSITQLDIRKVRPSANSENGAVLEVAKYSAKSDEMYSSKSTFEVFYKALKHRQLITYNGYFKDYVKKFKNKELEHYKQKDETVYTHMLTSLWKTSKYENMLSELSADEYNEINKLGKTIDEDDSVK